MMALIVYTTSQSFKSFISTAIPQSIEFRGNLDDGEISDSDISLLHISSLDEDFTLKRLKQLQHRHNKGTAIAVCSDIPNLKQMLDLVQNSVRAYCNSYMQTQHYQHMIGLLEQGQSWFPPQLLSQTFAIAQQSLNGPDIENKLSALTSREKDVALAVSEGMTNRQIADEFEITERTVKTHLTNIFKKLNLKDRVALVLLLK